MNNIKHILLATIASLGVIGCVGDLEPMPGTGPGPGPVDTTNQGKVLYDTTVNSIMAAKCSGCHTAGRPQGNTAGFLEADATKAYDTIVGHVSVVGNFAASAAPVLTKIANGHQSITYTTTELNKITTWLDTEIEIRNPAVTDPGPDPGPGPSPQPETASQVTKRLYKEWSGCMTLTDFQTANMAQGVGGWQANNNQECDNCHATAGEGFLASRDETFFFSVLPKHTALLSQYFYVDLTAGIPAATVMMNRVSFDGVSTRKAPHLEHPTFNSTDNGQGIQAIKAFYDLTKLHAATPATCEVPAGRIVD